MNVDELIGPAVSHAGCGSSVLFIDKNVQVRRPNWEVPMAYGKRTRAQLQDFLCTLGYRTDGSACSNCKSQCAFGREYAARYVPIPGETHVRTIVTATTPDGIVTTFTGFAEAARRLGLRKGDRIRQAAIEGRLFHGFFWHRNDLEMKEADE